jgi:hypothetical protein
VAGRRLAAHEQGDAEHALVTYDSDFRRRAILHDVEQGNDGRGGEIDVPQPGTGLVEDLAQLHRYQFELGFDTRVITRGQGVKQMILMPIGAHRRRPMQPALQGQVRRLPDAAARSTTRHSNILDHRAAHLSSARGCCLRNRFKGRCRSNFLGYVPYRTDVIQVSRICFVGEGKGALHAEGTTGQIADAVGSSSREKCSCGVFGCRQSLRYRT